MNKNRTIKEAKVAEIERENAELKANLESNKNQLDQLKNAYEAKVKELETKDQEIQTSISELREEHAAKVAELEKVNATLKASIEANKNELDELKRTYDEKTKALEAKDQEKY